MLIYFAIEKAKNNIKICVSTESDKISNIVKKQGIKVFKRSKNIKRIFLNCWFGRML